MHCEKESTRVFDFGIEVRANRIEVRDYYSQERMNFGNLKVRTRVFDFGIEVRTTGIEVRDGLFCQLFVLIILKKS